MIPLANSDHVIIKTTFAVTNDLIDAIQDANILPRKVPSNGEMGVYRHEIPRLDMALEVRYQLHLDTIRFDGYPVTKPGVQNEVRLGVPLKQAAMDVSLIELSTNKVLKNFAYAISGRAFIYGTILNDPNTKAAHFYISRLPEFKLDDKSNRIPSLLPSADLEQHFARMMNREIRASPTLPQLPGLTSFPVSFKVDDKLSGNPKSYGWRMTDQVTRGDFMSIPICLPTGYGSPECDSTQTGANSVFYESLDTYLRVGTIEDPVSMAPIGRAVQLDVGANIISREISKDNGWKKKDGEEWHEVALGMFRYRAGQWFDWKKGNGTGSIRADFKAEVEVAYPKIKWCKGWTKIFGKKISYNYPCGVTKGWADAKSMHLWIEIRLVMNGSRACVEIVDIGSAGKTGFFGMLWTAILLLIGIGISGGLLTVFAAFLGLIVTALLVAAATLVLTTLVFLEYIVGAVLKLIPEQICADFNKYLTVPIMSNKIDAELSQNYIRFEENGILIASNPDFEERVVTV